MKVSKLMLTYAGIDVVFVLTGGLIIGFSVMSKALQKPAPTIEHVAQEILVGVTPVTAGFINATIVFATFLVSFLVFFLPTSKIWPRLQGWLVVVCSIFTLVLGLVIWFNTLKTRANLSTLWGRQRPEVITLLQQKFDCCGYYDSQRPRFVTDATCPNPLLAMQKRGCAGPFASFANGYLDLIFTAAFGIVGVDAILLLCIVMVIQRRCELERYRIIDEKNDSFF